MKRNNYKWIAVLVTAIMLVSMASIPALGESNGELSGKVRFWSAYTLPTGMQALIDAFNQKYPGITVDYTCAGNNSDGNAQVDTALMAGESIDVLLSYTMAHTQRRAEAGLFYDITELCAAEGWDLTEEWGFDIRFNDNRIYSLPIDGTHWYVAINMDAWNEAGLGELPKSWTWDEYIEACRAMTTEDCFGGSDSTGADQWQRAVYQHRGPDCMYKDDFTAVTFLDNDDFRKVMARKYDMEVVQKLWYPMTEYMANSTNTQNTLLGGEVASAIQPNIWRFIPDLDNYPHTFKVGFVPYPTEEPGQVNYIEGASPYGHLAISRNAENIEATWAFAKFFATEGSVYLLNAGHIPMWKQTKTDDALNVIFGSAQQAEEMVDTESFLRVALNTSGKNYIDSYANSEVGALIKTYALYILSDEMGIDEGLAELTELSNNILAE